MAVEVGELTVTLSGDAGQLQQSLAGATRASVQAEKAMGDVAISGDLLVDRFHQLRNAARLGELSNAEYATQLRRVRADMAAFAASSNLAARDTQYFATASRQMQTELQRVSGLSQRAAGGLSRTAFGIATMAQSAQGGIAGLQGISSALLALSFGNPELMAAVAGFSAIIAIISLFTNRTKEASNEMGRFSRLLLAQRGITPAQTQEQLQADIDNLRRQLGETRTVVGPIAPGQLALTYGASVPAQREINVLTGQQRSDTQEILNNLLVWQELNRSRLATGRIELDQTKGLLETDRQRYESQRRLAELVSPRLRLEREGSEGFELAPEVRVNLFARMREDMAQSAEQLAEGQAAAFAGLQASIDAGADAISFAHLGDAFQGEFDALDEQMALMRQIAESGSQAFLGVFTAMGTELAGIFSGIGGSVRGFLARTMQAFSIGFRQVGMAILQAGIGKALGAVLRQLASALIGFGVAGKAIRNFIKTPVGAIAAGVALIALSAALSGAAQNIVNSGGEIGGGSAASASVATPPAVSQGTVTIIFPPGTAYDPSDPRFQDAIMRSIEAAQGRNVQIRVGGA